MVGKTTRPWLAGTYFTIAAMALLLCLAASAAAGTGGAPTAAGSPPPPGSPSGTPASDAPSAGALRLVSAKTTPRKSFYYGFRYPRLSFVIASSQAQNDIRIDVVDAAGAGVRTFFRNDVAPETETAIRWDGTTNDGRAAPNGRYTFQVSSQAGALAARPASASEAPVLGFAFYGYAFPLLGAHDYGGSGAVFGAGRSGHTHQGHDVMAECGVPIIAARGGQVQYSGYHERRRELRRDRRQGHDARLHVRPLRRTLAAEDRRRGSHRPADRHRRRHRLGYRLPPAFRDLDGPGLV